MSEIEWQFRLRHILDAIDFTNRHLEDVTYDQFIAGEVLQRAILHTLEIVGEATTGIPDAFTSQHPEVPWRGMKDFRNVIAYQYFQVNLELVWTAIHRDLLPLREHIARLLESVEGGC